MRRIINERYAACRLLAERCASRKLTAAGAFAELKVKHPGSKVIERDLAAEPAPAPGPSQYRRLLYAPQPEWRPFRGRQLSNQAVDQVFATDVIVIGAPMHNFAAPSSLKA